MNSHKRIWNVHAYEYNNLYVSFYFDENLHSRITRRVIKIKSTLQENRTRIK